MPASSHYLTSLTELFSTYAGGKSVNWEIHDLAQLLLIKLTDTTAQDRLDDQAHLHAKLKDLSQQLHTPQEAERLVQQFIKQQSLSQAAVMLGGYLLALSQSGCSTSTLKNYRSDINQFFAFTASSSLKSSLTKPKVADFLKWQHHKGLTPASIKRKVVALTQFSQWLEQAGAVPPGQLQWLSKLNTHFDTILEEMITHQSDNITQNILSNSNSKRQKAAAAAPVVLSTSHLRSTPLLDRLQAAANSMQSRQEHRHQLKQAIQDFNSKWARKAQQSLLPYINLLLSLLLFLGMGYFAYLQFFTQVDMPLAYPTALTRPNRTLSFQGRLTDTAQNPITGITAMRFRLFDSGPSTTGGNQLWDSNSCNVDPDQDGIFSVGLGSDCGSEITENVFSENSNVWLQVEIASEVLSPRQSIKTVPYALNAETVQGYPASASAVENTILVMNNSGQVVLGNANPLLKSTGDSFTIEAQTLTLRTSTGSDGDIVLAPDGDGKSIIQSDLDVTGYLHAPGATFSATYAGGTALVLQAGPSATADIMRWNSSTGSQLGVINSLGNIGIGSATPAEKLDVIGNLQFSGSLQPNALPGSSGQYLQSQGAGTAPVWTSLTAGSQLLPTGTTGQTLYNSSGTWTATSNLFHDGTNVGIGTTTVSAARLTVAGNIFPSVDDSYDLGSNSERWRNLYIDGTAYLDALEVGNAAGVAGSIKLWRGNGESSTISQSGATQYFLNNMGGGNFHFQAGGGSVYINSSGNLGLGSSSPAQKLDVSGNLQFSGALMPNGQAGTANYVLQSNGAGNAPSWVDVSTLSAASLWQNTLNVFHPKDESAGVVDLAIGGSATSSAKFQVFGSGINAGTATTSGQLTFRGTTDPMINVLNGENFSVRTSPGGDAGLTERLTILNNGNVGIGTTSPQNRLEVSGGLQITGALTTPTGGAVSISFESTYGNLQSWNGTPLMLNSQGNNVGIGTTTAPRAKFDVVSGSIIVDTNQSYMFGDNTTRILGNGVSDYLALYTSGAEQVRLINNGNLGIGSTAPAQKLDVVGNVQFSGALMPGGLAGTSGYYLQSAGAGVAPTWVDMSGVLLPTGTTGQTLYNNAGTWTATSNFFHDGTNVGIGTTVPGALLAVGSSSQFKINSSGNITSLGGVAHSIGDSAGTLTIGSNGALTFDDSTLTTPLPLTVADTTLNAALTQGLIDSLNDLYDIAMGIAGGLWTDSNGVTAGGTVSLTDTTSDFAIDSTDFFVDVSTGNIGIGTSSPLSLLNVLGTSTQLRLSYDTTNYTDLSVGSDGTLTIAPKGTTAATFGPTQNTFNLPSTFTAAGDVTMENNLIFSNQTASYITSNAPLTIRAGESYESNNLTLYTYNNGKVVFENDDSGVLGVMTGAGNFGIGTESPIGLLHVDGAVTGKALALLNATGDQDILTASASGVTKFVISNEGNVGIGSSLPSQKLDLVGNLQFSGALMPGGLAGTSGYYLQSAGAGAAPTWVDMSSVLLPTGTNGQTLYNASGTWTATSNLFHDGTNVGIGTTVPLAKLDIAGSASTSGTLTFRGTTDPKINVLNGEYFGIRLSPGGDAGLSEHFAFYNDGKLRFNGNGEGSNDTYLDHPSDGVLNFVVDNQSILYLTRSSQSVGIGTTSPGAKLHVTGTGRFDDDLTLYGAADLNMGDAGSKIYFSNDKYFYEDASRGEALVYRLNTKQTTPAFIIEDQAAAEYVRFNIKSWQHSYINVTNLGIGTTTPAQKLDIVGNLQFSGALMPGGLAGTSGYYLQSAGAGAAPTWVDMSSVLLPTGTNGQTLYHNGTAWTATSNLYNNGTNVGIGTTNPVETLDINGNIRSTNFRTYGLTRTVPTTVDDAVDIGTYTFSQNVSSLSVIINVGSANFSVAKEYIVPIRWNHTGGGWVTALPISSSGGYGGNDYSLDVNVGTTTALLRLRRTSGSTAGTAYILVRVEGTSSDTFVPSTTVNSVSAPSSYISSTSLTQVGGSVGIGTIAPSEMLDVAGSASIAGTLAFRGTTDPKLDILNSENFGVRFSPGGTVGLSEKFTILNNGNVGIGVTGPLARLQTGGQYLITNNLDLSTTGALITPTSGSHSDTESNVLTLGRSGINGVVWAGAARFDLSRWDSSSSNSRTQLNIKLSNTSTTDLTTTMSLLSNGYVGIGSTSPTTNLDIAGSASMSGTLAFRGTTDPKLDILNSENFGIRFSPGGTAGLSEKFTILNNGNVGIGSTTPAQALDVVGNLQFSGALMPGGLAGTSGYYLQSAGAGAAPTWVNLSSTLLPIGTTGQTLYNASGTWTATNNLYNNGTNVGVGATTPIAKLHVGMNLSDYASLGFADTGAVISGTSGDQNSAESNVLTLMRDGTSGQVYAGAVRFDMSRWEASSVNSRTQLNIKLAHAATDSLTTVMSLLSSGNVGIGTTSPIAKLDINGSIDVSGNASMSGTLAFRGTTDPKLDILNSENFGIRFSPGGTAGLSEKFTILNNGNVGIGSTTPAQALDVVGNLQFSGALMPGGLAGTSGYYLQSAGAGAAPTWVDMSSVLLPTGTNGQTLYNSSGTWTATSNFFHDGTNVGIGTTVPGALLAVGSSSQFKINSSGNISSLGGVAHSIADSSGTLAIASNGDLTFDDSTLTTALPLTVADTALNAALTQGLVDALNDLYDSAMGVTGGLWTDSNGVTVGGTVSLTDTTSDFAIDSTDFFVDVSTGNIGIGTSSPTSLLHLASTSTSTAFQGFNLDWSPGSSTTSTADLFSINIGANGSANNLFAIYDNGTPLFRVSETQIESAVPHVFSAAGDVSMAYDLNFTNPSAAYINFEGPGYIRTTHPSAANDLTLSAANAGRVYVADGLSVSAANIGKALTILNETGDQDLLTASASGVTKFTVSNTGNLTFSGALMPGGLAGTSGYYLQSAGADIAPTWVDLSSTLLPIGTNGQTLYNSSGTWTATSNLYHDGTNVGIGTTTVSGAKLTVAGNIFPSADDSYDLGATGSRWQDLYLGSNTLHIGSTLTDEGTISYDTTGNIFNFGTDSTTNGDIAFFTDDLYLDKSSGNVGIGTTAPAYQLDIATNRAINGMRIKNSLDQNLAFLGDLAAHVDLNYGGLQLYANGTEKITLDSYDSDHTTNGPNIHLDGNNAAVSLAAGATNIAWLGDEETGGSYLGALKLFQGGTENLTLQAWNGTAGGAKININGGNGSLVMTSGSDPYVWLGDDWSGGNRFGALKLYSDTTQKVEIHSSSDSYFNGGNVGIGTTTNIWAKLDIAGSASMSGTLAFRGTTDPKIDILNSENFGIRTSPGGVAGLSEKFTILNNGYVGIGTTSPGSLLYVDGNTTVAGNLGVGTANPSNKLHVLGQSYMDTGVTIGATALTLSQSRTDQSNVLNLNNADTSSGLSTVAMSFRVRRSALGQTYDNAARIASGEEVDWGGGGGVQDGYLSFQVAKDETLTERLRITSEGNIGLGTTTPTSLLDIAGSASMSGTLAFRGTTDPKIDILNGENFGIRTSPGGIAGLAEKLTILNNGNVGIGSTSPSQKLDIAGNLQFSGALMPGGAAGSSNYVLKSNGAGSAPTWVDLNTLSGSSLWVNTLNVLHAKNEYASVVDLALGGTSTASANILLQSNGQANFGGQVTLEGIPTGSAIGDGSLYINPSSNTTAAVVEWTNKDAWDAPNTTGYFDTKAFADLDGDGDYDLLAGNDTPTVEAYENTGSASSPTWTNKDAWDGPSGINGSSNGGGLVLVDIDNDGDADLYVSNQAYENTGSASSPTWTNKDAWDLPLTGASSFADLDNDGDLDVLSSSNAYENTGSATSPTWSDQNAWNTSTGGRPTLGDLDGDGDYDVIFGNNVGYMTAYENTGSVSSPAWTANTDWRPVAPDNYSQPTLVDLDNDTDLDIIMTGYVTGGAAYENTGSGGAGSNTLFGIAVNSDQKLKVDATGNLTLDGYVDSSSFGSFDYTGALAALTAIQNSTGDILNLFDGANEVFTVVDGGNVGIGTTSPIAKLEVNGGMYLYGSGDVNGDGNVDSTDSLMISAWIGNTYTLTAEQYARADINGDGNVDLLDSELIIEVNASEITLAEARHSIGKRLSDTIISRNISGNVGIGTVSPIGKLNIEGAAVGKALAILNETGDQDIFTASASGNTRLRLTTDGHIIPGADDSQDLGSSVLRWQDLYLGANTLHIGSSLTDEGTISYDTTGNIFNFGTDSTTNADIAFFTDDLYLDKSSGNVGIGTTSPGKTLDVALSIDGFAGQRITNNDTGTSAVTALTLMNSVSGLSIGKLGVNTTEWSGYGAANDSFMYNGSNGGNINIINAYASGKINFFTAGNAASGADLTIDSTGNVGIGTNSPNNTLQVANLINFNNIDKNTLLGYAAGSNLVSGAEYNTFVGYEAGKMSASSTNAADNNVAWGYRALLNNVSGNSNMAIGTEALVANTSGNFNAAVGRNTLWKNTTGQYNVAIGHEALRSNTTGLRNTAIGSLALWDMDITNSSDGQNTALGYNTGRGITTGTNNTIIGANVTGLATNLSNTIILADGSGNQRIYVNSNGNVGIGTTSPGQKLHVYSLGAGHYIKAETSGEYYVGFEATNSVRDWLMAVHATSGSWFVRDVTGGRNPLTINTDGDVTLSNNLIMLSTAVDTINFSGNSTSDHRGIAFNDRSALTADYSDGWLRINSGSEFTNGTYTPGGIRADAGLAAGVFTLTSGEVRADVFRDGNSSYYIQPADTGTSGVFAGNVGIGTTSPGYRLELPNVANATGRGRANSWTTYSDMRLKENLNPVSNALEKVGDLNPVYFDWKGQGIKDIGLIAQEVELIIPEITSTGGDGYMSIDYSRLSPLLIAAIQEQQLQIENLNTILAFNANKLNITSNHLSLLSFSSTGDLVLAGSNGNYVVTATPTGTTLTNVLAAAEVVIGRVTAGLVNTQELVVNRTATIADLSVNTLKVGGQNIADYINSIVDQRVSQQMAELPAADATPSAEIATLDVVELTADNSTIGSLTGDKSILGELLVETATVSGSLTVAGDTKLGSLLAETATISGTLLADRLVLGNEAAATSEADLEVKGFARIAQLESKMATLEKIKATTAELTDATVSGTLYASNIYNIDQMIADNLQQPGLLDTLLGNYTEPAAADPTAVYDPIEAAGYEPINPELLATSLEDLQLEEGDVVLGATAILVERYFQVNGTAYVAENLGIGQMLQVGSGLMLADGMIEYAPAGIDQPVLSIQPSGRGRLEMLAGLMSLENGRVEITGELKVAGNLEVENTLLTDLVAPRDFGNPLQVQVAGIATESGEIKQTRFEIVDETGQAVASFDAEGNAAFAGGIGVGKEDLTLAIPINDIVTTNSTSGKAVLPAGKSQLTIQSNQVEANSLVYITPRGSTRNQVLYVKSQLNGSFTVGFDDPIASDVEFNWWIVQ